MHERVQTNEASMRSYKPDPARELDRQLVEDLDLHNELIKRYAGGDWCVQQEIDELQAAILVKSLVARGARRVGSK